VAGWRDALQALLRDNQATRLVAGTAARLLYEVELLTAEQASDLLARMLSPGTPVAEAAGFFEGFFERRRPAADPRCGVARRGRRMADGAGRRGFHRQPAAVPPGLLERSIPPSGGG
jgi:hypothetical protein